MSGTADLGSLRKQGLYRLANNKAWVSVGLGTCGIGNDADEVFEVLKKTITESKIDALARRVGCFGFCAAEPIVMAYRPGKPILMFTDVRPSKAASLAKAVSDDENFAKAAKLAEAKIESWD